MEQSQNLWPINWPIPPILEGIGEVDFFQIFRDIPGFQSALLLRQVHALEHGTLSLLSRNEGEPGAYPRSPDLQENVHQDLSGLTTEQGFYVYGALRKLAIVRAAKEALERLTHGEWSLAIHPRCSTNWPVQLLLQSGLTLGLHLLLPKEPLEQLMGVGLAASLATELAPEAETWWQRYIMTAIPFNLEISEITPVQDHYGHPAHFVSVAWVHDHHA